MGIPLLPYIGLTSRTSKSSRFLFYPPCNPPYVCVILYPVTRTTKRKHTTMEQDTFYLVSFLGIPEWEEGHNNKICSRRYLFSSMEKATSFVRSRTDSPAWVLIHPKGEGSIVYCVRRDRKDGFIIRPIVVDEEDGEA